MHAWMCEKTTGVDDLVWQERPTPEPGPGEVRVRIAAASLNFPDLLIIQDKYQSKPELPFTPGSEFAGTVEALGAGVKHFHVGQNVACVATTGGFATHAVVAAARCIPLPGDFPLAQAAAFSMIYGTSHHALMDRGQLKGSETLLVLGAAGGVGTAAIQIGKAIGARVIAAASTDEKCAYCREQGADAAINYSSEDLRERLKALTDSHGPDVIFDPVGGDYTEPAFRSIAWRGRLLVIGFAAGGIPALKLNLALVKGASIVGVFWGRFAQSEPQANASMMGELVDWWRTGRIKPHVDRQMPMADLKAAYAAMTSRTIKGKLVLVNSS